MEKATQTPQGISLEGATIDKDFCGTCGKEFTSQDLETIKLGVCPPCHYRTPELNLRVTPSGDGSGDSEYLGNLESTGFF